MANKKKHQEHNAVGFFCLARHVAFVLVIDQLKTEQKNTFTLTNFFVCALNGSSKWKTLFFCFLTCNNFLAESFSNFSPIRFFSLPFLFVFFLAICCGQFVNSYFTISVLDIFLFLTISFPFFCGYFFWIGVHTKKIVKTNK